MSGPIVRTGTTPEFWKNWDRAFGKADGATKAAAGKKPAAAKASAGKKPAKKKLKK